MRKNQSAILISSIFLGFMILPYLLAYYLQGNAYTFSGFLLNPQDGYSYLAKIEQGYSGFWIFRLPFTANPGDGAYLFMFYILLGHISRLLNLPIILVFHAARIISSIILLISLYKYLKIGLVNDYLSRQAFLIALIGSGMGWILLFTGILPPDFWVAEAYPFLACFENPHFPLGLALMLLILMDALVAGSITSKIKTVIFSLLLSIILPFGMVIVILIVLFFDFMNFIWNKSYSLISPFMLIGGLPFIIYQLWVIYNDPIFSVWNSQNMTVSPSIIEIIISLSPALLITIPLARKWKDIEKSPILQLTFLWFITALILVFFPSNIQRRFLSGLYIPVAVFAVLGLQIINKNISKLSKILSVLFWTFLPLSNIILLVIIITGISGKSQSIFISNHAVEAITWISSHTQENALILANPEMGAKIPAFTGRRVVYGHPFETVDAKRELENLEKIYSGNIDEYSFIKTINDKGVDYILDGGGDFLDGKLVDQYEMVYSNEDYRIYKSSNQ